MPRQNVHATAIVLETSGLLIGGPSGSGKTQLALALLQRHADRHARLVSDDRTILHRVNDRLVASAPEPIRGLVEQRFIGIAPIAFMASARIDGVVMLGIKEAERLPPEEDVMFLDLSLPLLRLPAGDIFLAAGAVKRWIDNRLKTR